MTDKSPADQIIPHARKVSKKASRDQDLSPPYSILRDPTTHVSDPRASNTTKRIVRPEAAKPVEFFQFPVLQEARKVCIIM